MLPGLLAAALAGAVVSGPALTGNNAAGADGVSNATAAALAQLNGEPAPASFDEMLTDTALLDEMNEARADAVSRSDRRADVDPTKAAALEREAQSGGQVTRTERIEPEPTEEVAATEQYVGDPRQIAQAMLPEFGFSADQFSCLDSLWTKESGWNVYADNPTSSAYGIPQALPGEKMASAGADWATNPATQIRWGLGYIRDSYGSPCSAWSHSVANNWY